MRNLHPLRQLREYIAWLQTEPGMPYANIPIQPSVARRRAG